MASPFTNSSGESYTQEIVWNGYNSGLTPAVVQVLTKAQSLVDFPIVVRSGARSAEGNKAAGGAKASEHLGGNAVDISLKGLTEAQRTMLTRALVQAGAKRIGAYSGNTGLHIDMKAQGPAKGYPVWPMYDRSINNMGNAPAWFTAGLKGGPIPPMNIPDVASALSIGPTPATMSSQLARTRMASLAPMPMPRPASRMPATPGSTRMTDAEVAELYRGILPISRPSSALPVDPRLARPPSSLPAAPKPAPIPFLGADGSVKAPPGFPPWVGYGADNRMNQQGLGALLGKPVSLTAPNPAPSFAQQFASRLASVPSTTSRTVAPGAGLSPQQAQAIRAVPTAPSQLAAPGANLTPAQMQAIRAVPPTAQPSSPSFASQFASRIAAVPSSAPSTPASGPSFASAFGSRLAAVPPVPMPLPASRLPPSPAGHDQMMLARTGAGGAGNAAAAPVPATMSAALAASRMAQPSAAPMGLSFADKFSNAIAVGAMMNGGKAAPGIGGGSPLSFAPKAPSAAQLFLSGGYIYQQTPNGYVRVGKASAPIPATQSPALLAQRLATPATTFNPASSGSMWTSQSDYHQASGLGQHSMISN
jgi:hypothetical protein